jgi:hypothetical protein
LGTNDLTHTVPTHKENALHSGIDTKNCGHTVRTLEDDKSKTTRLASDLVRHDDLAKL